MGLSIFVGLSQLEETDFDAREHYGSQLLLVNQLLQDAGLPPHEEPEGGSSVAFEMFGYSGLHHLRRIAAHLMIKGKLPAPGGEDAADDPVMEKWYETASDSRRPRRVELSRFDHLMIHSDAEGYYVPIAFDQVLLDEDEVGLAGEMLGSSIRLRDECAALAAALELPLDMDPESTELWDAADSQGEGAAKWQRYGIESFTCLRLHAAAVASIETRALLVFA